MATRKLAILALSFSAAVFAANGSVPSGWLIPLGALFALGCVPAVWWMRRRRRQGLTLALVCAGLALGLLWTAAYSALFYAPAQALDGKTVRLSGAVAEWPQETDYGWTVLLRADSPNGVKVNTLLYLDGRGAELRPGDRVETVAKCTLARRTFSGEEITVYTAKGIFLRAQAYGALTVDRPDRIPLRYLPVWLAQGLKRGIAAAFPPDVAPLVRALVTGNRDQLTDSYTSSLQRTGLSHTVAVSGMHLVFLAGLLEGLLGRGRRRTAVITSAVVLLFMAITGCTPSIVRASVMLLMLEAAPLLGRERDSFTALSAALLLLLVQNPFAAAHVGLQLSFAAVAGILAFSDPIQRRLLGKRRFSKKDGLAKRAANRVVYFLAASLATTLGAMVFTTPLTALHFQTVSLIAPLSNLLTLWAVSFAFGGGLVVGAVGAAFPLAAKLAALPLSVFPRYLNGVIPVLARIPFASVTMDCVYYRAWLVFIYALLCAALLIPGKKRPLIPVCVCAITLSVCVLLNSLSFREGDMTVAVLDVGQGQSVVIRAGNYLTLVDCGGDGPDNAGDVAADYIQDLGRTKLDLLVISHYHGDHANGIPELLERISVAAIAMPDVEADSPLRARILELAGQRDIPVWLIRETTTVPLGQGAAFTIYPPLGRGETNELGLSVLATSGEFDALLTGDMGSEVETLLMQHARLPDIELLVAGHHGSRYSTSSQLLARVRPELAVISLGKNNAYGHPGQETLERLDAAGAEIYRTDLMGTVVINTKAAA